MIQLLLRNQLQSIKTRPLTLLLTLNHLQRIKIATAQQQLLRIQTIMILNQNIQSLNYYHWLKVVYFQKKHLKLVKKFQITLQYCISLRAWGSLIQNRVKTLFLFVKRRVVDWNPLLVIFLTWINIFLINHLIILFVKLGMNYTKKENQIKCSKLLFPTVLLTSWNISSLQIPHLINSIINFWDQSLIQTLKSTVCGRFATKFFLKCLRFKNWNNKCFAIIWIHYIDHRWLDRSF